MKNKFIKELEKDISFDPNYDDISNKVDVTKIIDNKSEKSLKFKLSIALSIVLVLFGGILVLFGEIIPMNTTINSNIVIPENDKKLVDNYDYIFIAKIEEKDRVAMYNGTGTPIPYTFYDIEEVQFIKGSKVSDESQICFYGGTTLFNNKSFSNINNGELEIGEYYLFFCNLKSPNSTNTRIGENDFIVTVYYQKILLTNYDNSKSWDDQDENINAIVKRYTNIINKEVGNDILNIPMINSKEELVSKFDYILIANVSELFININESGIHSSITLATYSIQESIYLKGEALLGNPYTKLHLYGVNYWDDEKTYLHYTTELENETVYLIFANIKDENIDDDRINENDLLILDNYQIIRLDNYDFGRKVTDQDDSVMNILNEYLNIINKVD